MKTLICLAFLCFILTLSAQQADHFTGTNSDQPRDPRADQMHFVPNEALVKFKDEVTLKAGTHLNSAGIRTEDKILVAELGQNYLNPTICEHLLQWDSGIQKGWFVYQLTVRQGKKQIDCPSRKMIVQ